VSTQGNGRGAALTTERQSRLLFIASCIALVATAMTFAVRGDIIGVLGEEFTLDNQNLGLIAGAAVRPGTLLTRTQRQPPALRLLPIRRRPAPVHRKGHGPRGDAPDPLHRPPALPDATRHPAPRRAPRPRNPAPVRRPANADRSRVSRPQAGNAGRVRSDSLYVSIRDQCR